ncbi:MAG TPA: metallophosphoesterase family protein, partial [Phycisphaeraceae bacterium]
MLVWMLAASLCLAADLLRGPYLQQATPDSIVIVWRTDDASDPVVRYGRSAASLDQHADGDAITRLAPEQLTLQDDLAASHPQLVKSPVATLATHQYEARLTRLEPETTYYYAVYDGQRRLAGGEDCFFTTPPRRGVSRPLRFWVIGDAGTGGSAQRRVFDAMRRYIDRTGRPLNLALYVGDIAYDHGTDEQFQHRYFEPYADLLRNTVMWGAMGNHEGFTSSGVTGTGPYYDAFVLPTQAEAGGIPSNTEAYYAFDYGPVHFISLNSYDIDRSPDGPMAQWLKRDLAQLGPDTRWLIAFWHHAPYSKGTHDSDTDREMTQMRENIMPILEDAGVDLVLTGHSHIYERSMLIDGAYATPTTARGVILDDGTGDPNTDGPYRKSAGLNPHEGHVHVVSGHGGNSTFRIGTCPLMRVITTDHGSVIVDIDGDTLEAVMVDLHGDVRDRFQIVKRGRVQPRPVDNPWQPEDWFGTPPISDPIHLVAPR